jgi:serine/threonine protein phosphatase PrpC
MITNAVYRNEQGVKSRPCEDRFRVLDARVPLVRNARRGFLYAVMDGVGSAPKALRAAQHVADRLTDFYCLPDIPATSQGIYDLLMQINREIREWGVIDGTDRPLGAAAATVAWFAPDRRLVVFHTGDTFAFVFDGSTLIRLTREHTDGRGITSYLGQGERCRIDVEGVRFEEGDILCLVTDGVTKSMADDHIEAVLKESGGPEIAVRELVSRARARGSHDDITAIVVELEEW